MYRTHTCGALRLEDKGQSVTLAGWLAKSRDLGGMTFIDLRDRYGITQLVFNMDDNAALCETARNLHREYVLQIEGTVVERSNKNPEMPTGDIEIDVESLTVLSESKVPPFTLVEDTDGGEELRMKYRYLDLRRPNVQENMLFRSELSLEVRKYLNGEGFAEIETPFLIKSTPEGARDFIVPSRMNPGQFYALPQSPQTFKQLLMISGFDKYFQIVKCFRDEDLRADRQPEFTQIDCEMSFVDREDVLNTFEGLTRHLFKSLLDYEMQDFPRMSYDEAIEQYGTDKPDVRFDMHIHNLNEWAQGHGFNVFDNAELVAGICVRDQGDECSNKDIKKLTKWVQRPQIGAAGLVDVRWTSEGNIKSGISKFYREEQFKEWIEQCGGSQGDMLLILSGDDAETRRQIGELRLEMGRRLDLMTEGEFQPLWVLDFPLLEWDEEEGRYFAMHHPFTAPVDEDLSQLDEREDNELTEIRANAYDLVINGVEIGGGSIRIHDRNLQNKCLSILGFSEEEAEAQFGFLMDAFEYGAPPHGGIAYGFDRLCAVMNQRESIRDFIAFPKNNAGQDVMLDAPASVDREQLEELCLELLEDQIQEEEKE